MKQLNSSTSPSNSALRHHWLDTSITTFWTIAFLVVIDVAVNLFFPYPSDVKKQPNRLQQYFDYGRSTEGKLYRMTGPTEDTSAPIVSAGWLETQRFTEQPVKVEPGDRLLVNTYGMSFSNRLGRAIERTHSDITVRRISAPSAPANWTYAAYQLDRSLHKANAVVFTVMSENIALCTTLGAMTAYFDIPYFYTQPQYTINNNKLEAIWPEIRTLADYRTALLEKPQNWILFRQQLSSRDSYYNPILFRASPLDNSALLRLVRRGYAQLWRQNISRKVYDSNGFNPNSEQVKLVQAMIRDFAATARNDGIIPVIYIVNNIGSKDHLYQVLKPILEQDAIPYVSSHTLAPADDPRLFLSDGHFLDSIDEALASEVIRIIDNQLNNIAIPSNLSE